MDNKYFIIEYSSYNIIDSLIVRETLTETNLNTFFMHTKDFEPLNSFLKDVHSPVMGSHLLSFSQVQFSMQP